MAVFEAPTIRQIYKCEFIGEVQELVKAASTLKALEIKVKPHPNNMKHLWRWTVEVRLAGEVEK